MLVEGNRMFPPNSVDSVTSNNEREKKSEKKNPVNAVATQRNQKHLRSSQRTKSRWFRYHLF